MSVPIWILPKRLFIKTNFLISFFLLWLLLFLLVCFGLTKNQEYLQKLSWKWKKCCLQILIYNYYKSHVDNLLEITAEKYMLVLEYKQRTVYSILEYKQRTVTYRWSLGIWVVPELPTYGFSHCSFQAWRVNIGGKRLPSELVLSHAISKLSGKKEES